VTYRLSDGAADRQEAHRAFILDGINHGTGRLSHFDQVVQTDIAA
jgi:hypothetical protein